MPPDGVGSLEGILGYRADIADREKHTSSGLDELSCNVSTDVSTVNQNANESDKIRKPDPPGIPFTTLIHQPMIISV